MKRLTTLFLGLLIVCSSFGQTILRDGNTILTSGGVVLYAWEAESEVIFAAMGTTPNLARKRLINDLVKGLKDDGVWSLLDFLYLLAAHAENSSLLNWINPGTFDATNVNATAYEIDRGYTGDGGADYLNSNYNPFTDAINYTQNSASIGVYIITNVIENKYDIGVSSAGTSTEMRTQRDAGAARTTINDNTFKSTVSTNSLGIRINTRTGATARTYYINKTGSSDAVASVSIPNGNIYILALNSSGSPVSFSTKQIAAAFAGGGFTQTDVNNFTDRIETFMDAINAGVID